MDWRVASAEAAEAASESADVPRRGYPWKSIIAVVLLAAMAGSAWWLWRGPAVTAAHVSRGDAAEIVYATGAGEPETWSRTTPLGRRRIVQRCPCEGKGGNGRAILSRLDVQEAHAALRIIVS